ncbi:SDR family NAD(P)-dependent oxidoreductase [Aspergillus homomorphus CBS 101889]|uniref:Short chain dehydrogenase/ reductase n=1 Tax=Aspergillus homomorphus (strain CBS 101889) TaxID=1450537 RepID=A0A395HUD0_ASPHC|nr:short chain dehydrogenase/ reductase [Aspergillus homomorphus CBS 101889]RAL11427.1 short chain dehydrogenase/ reductase [Aspergillus homomorphus CBS 101889]
MASTSNMNPETETNDLSYKLNSTRTTTMSCQVEGTALITGAGSGIGEQTALQLAANGISALTLLDIDPAGLDRVHQILQASHPGVQVLIMPADVADEAAVDAAFQDTVAKFQRVDIVINAAGVGQPFQPTPELSKVDWEKVIRVNLTGVWLCQRAAIRHMLEQPSRSARQGRGVIVNIASALGLTTPSTGLPTTAYVSSKHAVMGLTKSDARIYAEQGIRINAVCPGWVRTPLMQSELDSGALSAEILSAPVKRIAETEEIASAILFLASPMSSFVYGAGLMVDGGYSL